MRDLVIALDLRDSGAPEVNVRNHRSVQPGAEPYVTLVLADGVTATITVEQAEQAQLRLASAIALARKPKPEAP